MHADALQRAPGRADEGLGRDLGLALAVHLGIALLLFLGSIFSWQREMPAAAGAPIDASLELSASETRAAERALRAAEDIEPLPAPVEEPVEEDTVPPPQPIVEPSPQDSPVPRQQVPQERVPVPDSIDQDRADALAVSRERELREQEQKRRQEQIDLTERQRQDEAEKRRRLAEQQVEADKQKQLDHIRRQRAQLEQQKQLEEQKLRQLAEARARQAQTAAASQASSSPPAGSSGIDPGLLEAYRTAIQQAVASQWTKPDSVQAGTRCRVVIRQLPGGTVTSAEVQPGCAMDKIAQDYLERAVLKADPLPYRGFEDVFNRTLIFNFEAR